MSENRKIVFKNTLSELCVKRGRSIPKQFLMVDLNTVCLFKGKRKLFFNTN